MCFRRAHILQLINTYFILIFIFCVTPPYPYLNSESSWVYRFYTHQRVHFISIWIFFKMLSFQHENWPSEWVLLWALCAYGLVRFFFFGNQQKYKQGITFLLNVRIHVEAFSFHTITDRKKWLKITPRHSQQQKKKNTKSFSTYTAIAIINKTKMEMKLMNR